MDVATEQVQVISLKYDGSISRTWPANLVGISGNRIDLVGRFADNVEHPDLGSIASGTISYESFWTDRWYSIFRFDEPDGSLRNFYCNVNCPAEFVNNTIKYVDLDIDLVSWPDGRIEVLDMGEFKDNSRFYGYSETVIANALDALAQLKALASGERLAELLDWIGTV